MMKPLLTRDTLASGVFCTDSRDLFAFSNIAAATSSPAPIAAVVRVGAAATAVSSTFLSFLTL